MKNQTLVLTLAALAATGCATQVPSNSRPYSCADYNAARAEITANPAAVSRADMLKFLKINNVGFKTAIGKHPSKEDVMRTIDDSVDLQALQCRLAPAATVHYTAEQVAPGSVRLGYMVDFGAAGEPEAAKVARTNFKFGQPVENEAGMGPVKDYIRACASRSAPAQVCKLGGL